MKFTDGDHQRPTPEEMGIKITLAPELKGVLSVGSDRWSAENSAARRNHRNNRTERFRVKGRSGALDTQYANVPRHSHRRG